MTMFYWTECLNFGDEMNSWFWSELFDTDFLLRSDVLVCGIGSILSDNVLPDAPRTVVLGSGAGLASLPRSYINRPESWTFYCVRGPITAEILGVDTTLGISDPALLAIDLLPLSKPSDSVDVGFAPHWTTALGGEYRQLCEEIGFHYIDPMRPSKEVAADLISCKRVLTEAMHASIFCDSFRIPWTPISITPKLGPIKWHDWVSSVELEYDPVHLPVLDKALLAKRALSLHGTKYWYANTEPIEVDNEILRIRQLGPKLSGPSARRSAPGVIKLAEFVYACLGGLLPGTSSIESLREAAKDCLEDAARRSPVLSSERVWKDRRQHLREVFAKVASDAKAGLI